MSKSKSKNKSASKVTSKTTPKNKPKSTPMAAVKASTKPAAKGVAKLAGKVASHVATKLSNKVASLVAGKKDLGKASKIFGKTPKLQNSASQSPAKEEIFKSASAKSGGKKNEAAKPSVKQTAKSAQKSDKTKKDLKKNKPEDFDDLVPDDDLVETEDLSALDELEEASDVSLNIEEEVIVTSDIAIAASANISGIKEILLTDPEGRPLCRVRDCDQAASVEGYCRYHYLLQWKKIQVRRKILVDGKLQKYVDELTSRYPDKFLEMLKKDLRSEKEFLGAIAELDIDEAAIDQDVEDESQNFIDEVRGVTPMGMEDEESF